MPQTVSLAAFAPYTLLETLVIAANDGVTKETPQGSIILDSALPTLQSLTLDPWPFHVHKDQSLVQCMPRVQNLAVHVLSNKTQTMLVSSLKHLTLILHDYSEPFNPHVSQLQVPQEGLQLTRVKDELSHAEGCRDIGHHPPYPLAFATLMTFSKAYTNAAVLKGRCFCSCSFQTGSNASCMTTQP